LLAAAAAAISDKESQCDANVMLSKMSAEEMVQRIIAIKTENPENIMAAVFSVDYYNSLPSDLKVRFLQCCASGIYNSKSVVGCYATLSDDYDTFKPFFRKVIEKYHKVDLDKVKHKNNWSLSGIEGVPTDNVLDLSMFGLSLVSMRMQTRRNLSSFPLPASMTKEDRISLELSMGKVFDMLIADPLFGGKYFSTTPGHKNHVTDEEYRKLVTTHSIFKDKTSDSNLLPSGIAEHWPYGRGCYISEDKGIILWLGEEDHLLIMCMKRGTILNEVFDRLKAVIAVVEEMVPGGCAYNNELGIVTSCPTNIGTGMRASVHVQLPSLAAGNMHDIAKAVVEPLGLSVCGLGEENTPTTTDGTVEILSEAGFCISEAEIVAALYNGIKELKSKEDAESAKPVDVRLLEVHEQLLSIHKSILEVHKKFAN